MKKLVYLTLGLTFSLFAKGQSGETLEKIEAAKIALITQRLELTPEQAEKFWPIYNEYTQRQREINREFQELKRNFNPDQASEEENRQMLERGMQMKERRLDLERTYSDRMLQVINTRQLANLRKAEDDFRQMLMERVRQQRQRQQQQNQRQGEQLRDQRNGQGENRPNPEQRENLQRMRENNSNQRP